MMGFSATRAVVNRLRGSHHTFATSTSPKMQTYAPTADLGDFQPSKQRALKWEFVPVYVAVGMILLSVTLGLHTAKQQLMHSPTVRVRKSKRETLPEVEDPDTVVHETEDFLKKSFFRKVAHVQDKRYPSPADPTRGDAFAWHPRAETLKDVGIDLKSH